MVNLHAVVFVSKFWEICASMRDTYMNPKVEFTAFKIVLRNFDHAWDQVYNKNRILLQISDTYL